MRHRKRKGIHLGRDSSHRKAMLQNLAISIVDHELVKTTLPKAKAVRSMIENVITKSKVDNTANRRYVFDKLRNKSAVTKLFTDIGVRVADRPGGYIRILKCGKRSGDNAQMAYIQLVDKAEDA